MNKQLEWLKEEIALARKTPGRRVKIPYPIWSKINELSKSIPLKTICQTVGIDLNNARARIKKISIPPKGSKQDNEKFNFIQLPMVNSPILEITTPGGASIKVYSI